MSCGYCTPNKYGKRKPLYVQSFQISSIAPRIKKNTFKIYRERGRKRRYFLGVHSLDLSDDGKVTFRNNGFIMKKHINYCPICAKDLRV